MNSNPAFQPRPHQQQYVQRHFVQNQQSYQHHQHQHQQQQQQWLRRTQLGGTDSTVVDEVEKTIQSEAVDSRCNSWFMALFCNF